MSGNPKQNATGGQQVRYPYQPMQPQLTSRETFQITNQTYVPPPNQAGGQGGPLRGIGQAGPPNQAPTPPTQDLKVQAVPQQNPPMNLYQQQSAVRTNQQYNYRPQGPPNQTPRMANNQHRGQQQIYQSSPPTQFVQMPLQSSMYINPMTYFNAGQQRQGYVPQQVTLLQGQTFAAYPFNPAPLQQQPPAVAFPPYYSAMSRTGPPPQPASTQSNPNQTQIPPMPLVQPIAPQQPVSKMQKRRPNAVPIIDPITGANKLDEMFEQNNSQPPSGESSARQTPQPAPHNPNKEVQATFAKQVAQVLSNEEPPSYDVDRHSSNVDHVEPAPVFHPPPQQAVPNNTKYEHLVQTSTLKAHAKEFVLSTKETPVVSANCDSEEVTLPNKPQKGRESPAKGRKRDAKDHHKESSIKEVPATKEVVQAEKPQVPLVKEEPPKPKEAPVPVIGTQQSTKFVEREIEKRKKENKSDTKPPSDSHVVEPSVNQEPEPPVPTNTKSKQNASQKKDTQKANQKSGSSNVPPPQPAKSNSKTSKKNEINNKGASKEGTEMDVFDIADAVNANVPTTTDNSDLINANTETVTNNTVAPVVNSNSNNAVQVNKVENNDTVVVPKTVPEPKPVQRRVDVTDVFGGKLAGPAPVIPNVRRDNRDETDRAAFANDRTTLTDVNASRAGTSTDVIEPKSELPYKKGQWTPNNIHGEKKYDREFLLAVKNLPIILKLKPRNIPENLEWSSESRQYYDFQRLSDNRYNTGRNDFINPPFMGYGGKNSSMKGLQSLSKHPSLSGKMNNKGGGKSTNGGNKISISLREEVKLRETENAWKPGRLAKDAQSDEERKTIELYKRVRGVLNKLTPQKFDTLLNQIKSLKVDTIDRLQGVINLIFEKAVDEPNFSVAYAKMCKELSLQMQVSVNSDKKKEDIVNFRKLLINRCQEEFEKNSKDETSINEKLKEIEISSDPEKKKDLQFELEEIHRRIRMRSVGNIRFIGELFKFGMLTTNIMMTCLNILLTTKDEESLECLCKLMTTVGKELEDSQQRDLSKFFGIMQDIVDKKTMKCSSRIRFMLQDVIDLRKNKWVPRRQDMNPKTIDQIQKEAENEHLNQAMNSVPHTPRKSHIMDSEMNKSKSRQSTIDDGGWTTARNQKSSTFSVSKDKLKTKEARPDDPPSQFMPWGKGSQGTRLPQTLMGPSTTNKFAILDSGDCDRKISGGRYKDFYCPKGSSLERGNYNKHSYENRGAIRSGSQHRMNDVPMPTANQRVPQSTFVVPVKPEPVPPPQMNDEQMLRYFRNRLDEFINDNSTYEECEKDIKSTIHESYMQIIVTEGFLAVLEKFSAVRLKTGTLFSKLIKFQVLPLDKYCAGVEEILNQVEDLILDIPTIWNCLAEILAPAICDEVFSLNNLQKCSGALISSDLAYKLLAPIFKHIIREKDPNFLKMLWEKSELKLSSFMTAGKVEQFLKENQFEFLNGGQISLGNSEFSYEQIEQKLLEFFKKGTPFDIICNWITANVGKRVEENMFIRTLAVAIYKYSMDGNIINEEKLRKTNKLFQKYVDSNPTYELQCLYALQSLINILEHPSGLLLAMFNKLNENSILSQESFIAWENSNDPAEQEGKGVAMKQLTSFFTQLKENEDDYCSSEEEA
ncbi:hypothetical protein WA026_000810 [Henosepilachna vigintioctopunctata]|uniref:Uncharacterized protein n=1 Tax=Henosepilachna vigintioctopunctata TaxID=420089 RepID=A0AAW1UYT7_9CUCU